MIVNSLLLSSSWQSLAILVATYISVVFKYPCSHDPGCMYLPLYISYHISKSESCLMVEDHDQSRPVRPTPLQSAWYYYQQVRTLGCISLCIYHAISASQDILYISYHISMSGHLSCISLCIYIVSYQQVRTFCISYQQVRSLGCIGLCILHTISASQDIVLFQSIGKDVCWHMNT